MNIPPPELTTPTFTPSVPLVGGLPGEDTVSFSVGPTANSGPITSYLWTFPDATTSTLQNPTFTFTATGAFTVTVTATGPGGTDGALAALARVVERNPESYRVQQHVLRLARAYGELLREYATRNSPERAAFDRDFLCDIVLKIGLFEVLCRAFAALIHLAERDHGLREAALRGELKV